MKIYSPSKFIFAVHQLVYGSILLASGTHMARALLWLNHGVQMAVYIRMAAKTSETDSYWSVCTQSNCRMAQEQQTSKNPHNVICDV